MKKILFFSACAAFLMVAAFVYSCQKEAGSVSVTSNLPSAGKVPTEERNATCTKITIANGTGLFICGIDLGTLCSVCTENHAGTTIAGSPATYGFSGSSVFSLTNSNANPVNVTVSFNCLGQTPQTFTIPGSSTVTFRVNVVNGCCTAVSPC